MVPAAGPPRRSVRGPARQPSAPRDRGSWAHSERTTPSSQLPSGFVTITHPHHPLRGQQLLVVCVRHGEHPDVIVRLPDGNHAAVAVSATDYAAGDAPPSPLPTHASVPPAPHGLRWMAQLLEGPPPQRRFPDPSHCGSCGPSLSSQG